MIGILSDAHGNYYAFVHAINILKKIGVDEVIFLGDAVGYIPSMKVVDYLMNMPSRAICIRGNHEDMLIHENFDHNRDQVYQLQKTKSSMNEAAFNFILSWKISHTENTQAGRLLFVHGSPSDPTFGYVYPDSDLSMFSADADFVFMGHSHHPFIRKHNQTTYINVGSCGLPRDDGRYGSAALFDTEKGAAKIIRFDIRGPTENTLAEVPDVHSVVTDVFDRKKKEIYGEVYGE